MLRIAFILILLAVSASVGLSQQTAAQKARQIANANWVDVTAAPDETLFYVDTKTISKVKTVVIFNVKSTLEGIPSYVTVIGGCTTDTYSSGNFWRQPLESKRLVRVPGETSIVTAEPYTVMWYLLEFACERAK